MKNWKSGMLFVLLGLVLVLTGCRQKWEDVGSGQTGKLLTPTGFTDGYLKPGQVDIGVPDVHGRGNSLILMTASSVTIKEAFLEKGEDGADHRLTTADSIPLMGDLYIQVAAPDPDKEPERYDQVYTLIEPQKLRDRVSQISLEEVYSRLAKQHVRGGFRGLVSGLKNWEDVLRASAPTGGKEGNNSLLQNSAQIMVVALFRQNKVPLDVLAVTPSNLRQDPRMLTAAVDKKAMLDLVDKDKGRIEGVAKALREYPEYSQILYLERLKDVIESANAKGHLIIMNIGGQNDGISSQFAAAEYLKKSVAPAPAAK